ncbi:MAG: hypothetical protein IT449_08775 [Phycisphaerales bacterium]|nr:hypothetical protein [Phycisphaerales bacterium]
MGHRLSSRWASASFGGRIYWNAAPSGLRHGLLPVAGHAAAPPACAAPACDIPAFVTTASTTPADATPAPAKTASVTKSAASDPLGDDPTRASLPMSRLLIAMCLIVGLVLLSLGGLLASDGASGMALALGVPAAVVGVTVVSIGTTLPEMVTSVMAVRKGQTDLAMGNAIGSCLFNAGAIFGLVELVVPPGVDGALVIPLGHMGILAGALVPISRTFGKTVSRSEGGALLASHAVLLALSALTASRRQHHRIGAAACIASGRS